MVVMLEVLTSGKDTDRYHFAEQGFVALHIFILSQDFNFKILAWRTSRLLTGRWDLFLATGSNFRVRGGRDDTRLTGVSLAARNNVGDEALLHTSNMGRGNLEFLNIRRWDR